MCNRNYYHPLRPAWHVQKFSSNDMNWINECLWYFACFSVELTVWERSIGQRNAKDFNRPSTNRNLNLANWAARADAAQDSFPVGSYCLPVSRAATSNRSASLFFPWSTLPNLHTQLFNNEINYGGGKCAIMKTRSYYILYYIILPDAPAIIRPLYRPWPT